MVSRLDLVVLELAAARIVFRRLPYGFWIFGVFIEQRGGVGGGRGGHVPSWVVLLSHGGSGCFLLIFYFVENQYKRSPNTAKLFVDLFSTRRHKKGRRSTPRVPRGGHNPPGSAWGPRRALVGCAHLGRLPHRLFAL